MEQSSGDLAFLPLGGTGEIGMNLNLYRCDGRWLAVDCGIGFGGAQHPEVEVMVADPAFIAERRDQLVGLVITHAHEDHIGAVAWLWPLLRCPVYATPFAAAVLRRKLGEVGLLNSVEADRGGPRAARSTLAPFSLRFLRVTHSIPEAQALVIETPYGIVLHTGDWKLDPHPLVGPATDEAALAALGDRGVLAMVCDSTNAMVEGHSGSEQDVRQSLGALIRGLSGRVAVTCFASNVARVESIALAAQECGPQRGAGRPLPAQPGRRGAGMRLSARRAAVPRRGRCRRRVRREPADAGHRQPGRAAQRAGADRDGHASARRAGRGRHGGVLLPHDPGNERAIGTVQDNLVRRGVRLMTDIDHLVHVSGHPARDELRRLYRLVRPRYAVPVHGEWRHLTAHAELAREAGARPILLEDGDILSLAPGTPEIVDSAPVGRLALDGNRLVPLTGGVMAARRRMLFNGVVVGSLAVDRDGRVRGQPRVSAPGPVRAGGPGERPDRRRIRRRGRRSAAGVAARRCGCWQMPRGPRCAARWAGGCRSGRWWMCICCGSSPR